MGDIRSYEGFWKGLKDSLTILFQPCKANLLDYQDLYHKKVIELQKKQINQKIQEKSKALCIQLDEKILRDELQEYKQVIGGKSCGSFISFLDIITGRHLGKAYDLTE